MPIKELSQLANLGKLIPGKKEQQVGSKDELYHKTENEAVFGNAAPAVGSVKLGGAGPGGANSRE